MSKELKTYIETALTKGVSKEQISETLTGSGWSKEVIYKMLGDYSGVDSMGIPVPAPKMQAHQISRDLFVYFIIFITLSMTACGVGGLFFECIDYLFPENLVHSEFSYNDVSWAIAQLVIAFPILILLSNWINKNLLKHPEKRESLVRKLMIYFILTITAIVSIVDLVIVLTSFLKGDITIAFILNALVVLVIALIIFSYYFYEVKEDDNLIKTTKKET